MGTLFKVSWLFLKIGLVFFGGGYVLIPLLHRIMVDQYRWLTLREFLDGIAISQLTPGPLAMLATFTGFKAAGFAGAALATLFIFMPCTLLMLALSSGYERIKNFELMRNTLEGLLPGVVGIVAGAAWSLGKTSLTSLRDIGVLVVGFMLLRFTRASPMVVILAAGGLGYLLRF